ncbi:UDP-2,3-diacylglucosamine diphosphatase [Flavobacteriaceae bacterium S356]|uniref:UDP-2,3-diacylglucosamine diphosphatase n=1 Tax=Asprobacillus argus TaxID=3076534 RepID=A0ABU3LFH0_9FLAO|nr:UDP-2,3-diacylglucosamine diphosphatase [Flavobacteriaceae bacterium S356]
MKKFKKRKLDVVVVSDIHLGTFGCRAQELLNYLKTINPKILILNGDIIDIWQFNKRYFPKSHMKVIKYITSLLTKGTKVYYITGNHDEMLRKFKGFRLGSFEIVNKLVLDLDGKKAWIFHGDVFDVSMKHAKWLAKLGGVGYDILIMINTFINFISNALGFGRLSLSKRIKNSVKSAVKFINNFEDTAASIAMDNKYDYVICGHIHQPQKRIVKNKLGQQVLYLNSGDWIENLTALEYQNQTWSLYEYSKDEVTQNLHLNYTVKDPELVKAEHKSKDLFKDLLAEFDITKLK